VTQDLHNVLPVIIENIFGFGVASGPAYGCFIGPQAYVNQSEFNVICDLLGPEGSLLRVVYKLAADSSCRYEFPISCLPVCYICGLCGSIAQYCATLFYGICCCLVSVWPSVTSRFSIKWLKGSSWCLLRNLPSGYPTLF